MGTRGRLCAPTAAPGTAARAQAEATAGQAGGGDPARAATAAGASSAAAGLAFDFLVALEARHGSRLDVDVDVPTAAADAAPRVDKVDRPNLRASCHFLRKR